MIRPDTRILYALTNLTRTHPDVVAWLDASLDKELRAMPYTAQAMVGVAQGRCQLLTELLNIVKQSPTTTARPHGGADV